MKLREKMILDMQLNGLALSTQVSYVNAIKRFSRHFNKSPEKIGIEELGEYYQLLYARGSSQSTFKIFISALKFFYQKTLGIEYPLLKVIRPPKRIYLRTIYTQDEIKTILSFVKNDVYRNCLLLIYSCGLRISEGVGLKVTDFDKNRKMIAIHNSKGGKGRFVPYPATTAEQLKAYWKKIGKPMPWLFPCLSKPQQHVQGVMVRRAFKMALLESGLNKNGTVHSLRHSYATHLYENKVDVICIKELLGHRNLKTTALYTHMTDPFLQVVHTTLDQIMEKMV